MIELYPEHPQYHGSGGAGSHLSAPTQALIGKTHLLEPRWLRLAGKTFLPVGTLAVHGVRNSHACTRTGRDPYRYLVEQHAGSNSICGVRNGAWHVS